MIFDTSVIQTAIPSFKYDLFNIYNESLIQNASDHLIQNACNYDPQNIILTFIDPARLDVLIFNRLMVTVIQDVREFEKQKTQ